MYQFKSALNPKFSFCAWASSWNGSWYGCQFCQARILLSQTICFHTACEPRWFGCLPLQSICSSWCLGSGGCAIFHGTAYQFDLVKPRQYSSSFWLQIYAHFPRVYHPLQHSKDLWPSTDSTLSATCASTAHRSADAGTMLCASSSWHQISTRVL